MRVQPTSFLALLLLLTLTACDSNDVNEEPPVVTPPSFSIASTPVQMSNGSAGILFAASPNEDVILVRVEITNPLNERVTFNAGSATVVQGQALPLQDAGTGYFRVSGTWRFQFVGRKASGDQTSFDVSTTLSVSA